MNELAKELAKELARLEELIGDFEMRKGTEWSTPIV